MAGITEVDNLPGHFSAYVVRHTTGETLGVQEFDNLFEAIRTLNDIPRPWNFEAISKCGGGNCNAGSCGKEGGGCGGKKVAASAGLTRENGGDCSTGACPS